MRRKLRSLLSIVLVLPLTCSFLLADDSVSEASPSKLKVNSSLKRHNKPSKADTATMELFEAIEQGVIAVDYIGRDATEANLIFRNQGDESLNILLPATFGAVPVLAQGFPGGGGGGFGGGQPGGGGGQGIGGGFGGGGGGGNVGGANGGGANGGGANGGGANGGGGNGGGANGGGPAGGFFRVEPDRPRKMTVATVCLNHGKADPNPKMKYKVVRLADVNDSLVVVGFCRGLASGKVSQKVAQAAAWHATNGLTWDELIQKPKVVSEYTGVELFFSKFEIEAAIRLTEHVTEKTAGLAVFSPIIEPAYFSGTNRSLNSKD